MPILQILIYASLVVFFIGVAVKAVRIASMPIHLRWELYPIPHEKGKGHYGGSRYEEPNWWTRPIQTSRTAEIAEMAREIFAIKTLYRNNRGLWYFSLAFHWGLYLLIAFAGLLAIGAILGIGGAEISSGSDGAFEKIIHSLTIAVGVAGWALGAIGAAGLLLTRTLVAKYRAYSLVSDYFNLLLLLALFIVGFTAWTTIDRSFDYHRTFAVGLITFKLIAGIPMLINIEFALTAFFLAYLPFTHMTHFMGKFFTFHLVRWQDLPNVSGSGTENEVAGALGKRVGWAAPHMAQGKTWAEGAAGDAEEQGG